MSDAEQMILAGRYRLVQAIGEGSFSITWRATDAVLGRDVAIKVLREQFVQNMAFATRFENEARAAALISHPNVIPVFDYGRDNGSLYIVMEYVGGPTFKEYLRNEAPLDVDEAIEFTRQILEGLGAIHDAGIIHRDVKPQNVLMVHERLVKITDFGIARVDASQAGLTDAGTALGTAAYMAPEQASGQGVAPATDLYAVGVMLYEMLTGRLPFVGDNPVQVMYRHVNDVPQPPRTFNRQIPVTLEALILKSLAKEPGDRYPTARSMRDALVSPGPPRATRPPQADPDQVTAVAAAVGGAAAGAPLADDASAAGVAPVAAAAPVVVQPTRVPPPPLAPPPLPPSSWTPEDDYERRRSGWLVGVVLVLLLAGVLLAGTIYALTNGDDDDNGGGDSGTATATVDIGATETAQAAEDAAATETAAAGDVEPTEEVEPTATATLEPTATATLEPPTPTLEPTATATLEPTATATLEPTATATLEPPTPTTEPPTPTTPPAPTVEFNTPLPLSEVPAAYFQRSVATFSAGDFEGAYRRDDGELYDLPAIHLYSTDSDFSSANAGFSANESPSSYILITIVGLDDERSAHTGMRLLLNGNEVWSGPSPFANEQWTEVAWIVGNLDWMSEGGNELTIECTEGGGDLGEPPWFLVTTAAVYFD